MCSFDICSVEPMWWLTLVAIVLSGALGGISRYLWEKSDESEFGKHGRKDKQHKQPLAYVVMGIASALMVPLFLNTISSTLVKEVQLSHDRFFVLIGFCVAAGAFSKQFIGSVAGRALEMSQKATKAALEAKEAATVAGANARSADNRAIALYQVLKLVDENSIEGALAEVNRVLDGDPLNAEAWAWRGYCLKRTGNFPDAIESMERALAEEGREVYNWLYNLACYQSLAGKGCAAVLGTLRRAEKCATEAQLSQLKKDLLEDEDFGRLNQDKEFVRFVASL